jgi:hypothetical protein
VFDVVVKSEGYQFASFPDWKTVVKDPVDPGAVPFAGRIRKRRSEGAQELVRHTLHPT